MDAIRLQQLLPQEEKMELALLDRETLCFIAENISVTQLKNLHNLACKHVEFWCQKDADRKTAWYPHFVQIAAELQRLLEAKSKP